MPEDHVLPPLYENLLSLPVIISNAITRPVLALNNRLTEIASGDGDLTATLSERALDEIGDTARVFNIFIKNHQMPMI